MTLNMTQHIYNESGINIDLSDYSHFRFENCEGYRKIKGFNVKEIDFGWWNEKEEGNPYKLRLAERFPVFSLIAPLG